MLRCFLPKCTHIWTCVCLNSMTCHFVHIYIPLENRVEWCYIHCIVEIMLFVILNIPSHPYMHYFCMWCPNEIICCNSILTESRNDNRLFHWAPTNCLYNSEPINLSRILSNDTKKYDVIGCLAQMNREHFYSLLLQFFNRILSLH